MGEGGQEKDRINDLLENRRRVTTGVPEGLVIFFLSTHN